MNETRRSEGGATLGLCQSSCRRAAGRRASPASGGCAGAPSGRRFMASRGRRRRPGAGRTCGAAGGCRPALALDHVGHDVERHVGERLGGAPRPVDLDAEMLVSAPKATST